MKTKVSSWVWVIGMTCIQFAFAGSDIPQLGVTPNASGIPIISIAETHLEQRSFSPGASLNLASLPSCDANEIGEPATAQEIQRLVTQYAARLECVDRLHLALDAIFEKEPRDERWAEPLERLIADAAAKQGATVSGGCHSSLCRYDVQLSSAMESSRVADSLDRRVIDAATGTPFEVASVHNGSQYKYRTYFYTTVAPAVFIGPLKRKIKTDKQI
jgi:hypothetical protein